MKVSFLIATNILNDWFYSSLNSCFCQDFDSFEVVVVVNGSDYLNIYNTLIRSKNDARLIVCCTNVVGLSNALNYGLNYCKGVYIARMDSDDFSEINRLRVQVDLLDKDPTLSMVCSSAVLINETGDCTGELFCESGIISLSQFIFRNPIIHPSVMIRSHILRDLGGYVNIDGGAEDYFTWLKVLMHNPFGIKGIAMPLIRYRSFAVNHPRLLRVKKQQNNLLLAQLHYFLFRPDLRIFVGLIFTSVRIQAVNFLPLKLIKKFRKDL